MKYRIYRNLHAKNWTVQHKIPGIGWRKAYGARELYAPSVDFVVSSAGRKRARAEKTKNVHAFAIANEVRPLGDDDVAWDLFDTPHIYVINYTPFDTNGFAALPYANLIGATDCLFRTTGTIAAVDIHQATDVH